VFFFVADSTPDCRYSFETTMLDPLSLLGRKTEGLFWQPLPTPSLLKRVLKHEMTPNVRAFNFGNHQHHPSILFETRVVSDLHP
jgi:hypothetical protein